MKCEPWTSRDAPRWKRMVAWGLLAAIGLGLYWLLMIGQVMRMLRLVVE